MDATSIVVKKEPIDQVLGLSAYVPHTYTLLLLCLPALLFFLYRKQKQARFKQMKVPFVENCNFLLGNLAEYARTPLHKLHQQWTKKYGKTYCYFEGPSPIMVTSDLDILHEVLVKQFQNFGYRKDMPLVPDYDTHPYVHTFIANGPRWKRLRTCSSAFFTTGRLRSLQEVMHSSSKEMAEELAKADGSVDIFSVVSKEVYGLQQRVLRGKYDRTAEEQTVEKEALHLMLQCLDASRVPLVAVLGLIVPEANNMWLRLYYALTQFGIQELPGYQLFHHVKREATQLLRAAERNATESRPSLVHHLTRMVTDHREVALPASSRLAVSYSEMVAELFINYFTQSTFGLSFSMCLYLLAKHPKVQKRLQEEIDQCFMENSDGQEHLDYDKATQSQYLSMVLNETFRMYPLFQVIHRLCTQSTRVCGLDIPAGVTVQPDLWSIHYNPEIWGDDVNEFNPDRFLPDRVAKRHPLAMLTFGAGPRMCFGRRFVLVHMKTLLCELLHRFTVVPNQNGLGLNCMPQDMDTVDLDMVTPRQKILVAFEPRNC